MCDDSAIIDIRVRFSYIWCYLLHALIYRVRGYLSVRVRIVFVLAASPIKSAFTYVMHEAWICAIQGFRFRGGSKGGGGLCPPPPPPVSDK